MNLREMLKLRRLGNDKQSSERKPPVGLYPNPQASSLQPHQAESNDDAKRVTVFTSPAMPVLWNMIPEQWRQLLRKEFKDQGEGMQALSDKVEAEYRHGNVFPPKEKIFRALQLTNFDLVRVVIIGQDPYHTPGQANGLAFSCELSLHKNTLDCPRLTLFDEEQPKSSETGFQRESLLAKEASWRSQRDLQPSLVNIFTEIERDVGAPITHPAIQRGDLSYWAKQGVLLLNSVLTVKARTAHSHQSLGWQPVTSTLLSNLLTLKSNLVFLLWGKPAHQNGTSMRKTFEQALVACPLAKKKHLVLVASHPSPLSYKRSTASAPSFCGCGHFRQCNAYLSKTKQSPIKWHQ